MIIIDKYPESSQFHKVYLSVCIITYRRPLLLAKCLDCITPKQQTLDSSFYEILVSDDCPDESAREVVNRFACAYWLKGPCRGVAANRNNVAKAATGSWLVYVDDDELPRPDWLECIFNATISQNWDVIEGRVEAVDLPDSVFWYAPSVRQGGMCCTANLSIRRDLFYQLAGFDEKLTISHEDIEFGKRIRTCGARVLFLDSALVLHPARRISFQQLCLRTIQQQCQSYLLDSTPNRDGLLKTAKILLWSIKYLYRSFKMRKSIEGFTRWKSFSMETVLRLVCCPFACLRLILG